MLSVHVRLHAATEGWVSSGTIRGTASIERNEEVLEPFDKRFVYSTSPQM